MITIKQSALAGPFFLLVITSFLLACSNNTDNTSAASNTDTSVAVYGPYKVFKLPITKGIKILNPIMIASGAGGKMFAANQSGEVYTLADSDGDGLEDEATLYCNVKELNLRSPAGFAHKGDTIFIGTSQEIRIYLDRDKDGKADTSWTFFNDISYSEHPYEWTCGLSFGPDGWLYFALSTDSWNAGPSPDPKSYRGSILRISPDGKRVETMATGIRSVYGMGFNQHGDLFFTDNEGGGNLKEELNLVRKGGFYGHNPNKYPGHDSAIAPVHALQTEMAPSEIEFNATGNDFGGAAGDLFVGFYGPGERWTRGGVARIRMEHQQDGSYQYKETAIADIPKLSSLAFAKDGALYLAHHGIADYWYNSVEKQSGGFYKIVYDPSLKDKPARTRKLNTGNLSVNSIESGKQLFAQKACLACHATGGSSELLGPGLTGIGSRLSREEILEEIEDPSRIIKPSMGGMRVTKKDGKVLLDRVVTADEKQISLMLVGNNILRIPRNEIAKNEDEKKSLMYEKLLNGMSSKEINSLLDYIVSLK
jgi:putative heme-binding domain-containing protein